MADRVARPPQIVRTTLRLCLLAALLCGCRPEKYEPRDGDIIFQSFPHNALTDAIEGITSSGWSHCGIVHRDGSRWLVLEAVGPVKETPLDEWIARGRDGHFAAFRLAEKYQPRVPAFLAAAARDIGRPYDIHYRFGDRAIYCSELVYESFKSATGEELGNVQSLGELNWKPHEAFIRQIENGDVPLMRRMITPVALTRATQLEPVFSNDPASR
ncbi:MAG: YiiX/YebB-like N1pC/P60 family cysteine hydrolase [Chthoniobacterales bacterium]